MRILWIGLLASTLSAQVWEGPGTLVQREQHLFSPWYTRLKWPRDTPALVRTRSGGAVERLEAPGWIGGQSWGPRLSYWQGVAYAYGRWHHPAAQFTGRPDEVGWKRMQGAYTLHFYRSEDFRTWKPFATYTPDDHGEAKAFEPLGNGWFLATHGPFCSGKVASPFAVYERGQDGRLRFHHLVELPFGQSDYRVVRTGPGGRMKAEMAPGASPWAGAFQAIRTQAGLVLLRPPGQFMVLDNQDGRVLRHGDLLSTRAVPRPDGKVLIARRGEAWNHMRMLEGEVNLAVHQSRGASRLAMAMLRTRHNMRDWSRLLSQFRVLTRLDRPDPTLTLRWAVLDPSTGSIQDVAPPQGFPAALTEFQSQTLRMWILPDGNLQWLP